MKKNILFIIISSFLFPCIYAQKESKDVRAGNRFYKDGRYTDAEISYRKGLDKNNKSFEANFNLGDALYKQGKTQEAMQQFMKSVPMGRNKKQVAAAFHNIGNSFFKAKDYAKSVTAYSHSLVLNPNDPQTRYNLALAEALLKNQQQQNKKNKKDNKKKKDDDKKKQDKKQNKQNNQGNNQNRQTQPQPDDKMSKENAKQILDAFLQDEKDVQNRVKENQKKNAQKRNVEKDW